MAGSRGTQACINAAATVNAIVNDLDTTVMFATAGTMNPEATNDQFSDHRYDNSFTSMWMRKTPRARQSQRTRSLQLYHRIRDSKCVGRAFIVVSNILLKIDRGLTVLRYARREADRGVILKTYLVF